MTNQNRNEIIVKRTFNGYSIFAIAQYDAAQDGWNCLVREPGQRGPIVERRGPDETGNDVWATLLDMIDLALHAAESRDRLIAGPFSTAQSTHG